MKLLRPMSRDVVDAGMTGKAATNEVSTLAGPLSDALRSGEAGGGPEKMSLRSV